jgi:hypothetical protein
MAATNAGTILMAINGNLFTHGDGAFRPIFSSVLKSLSFDMRFQLQTALDFSELRVGQPNRIHHISDHVAVLIEYGFYSDILPLNLTNLHFIILLPSYR